jgi:membrane-associated phospholipid phosphatase
MPPAERPETATAGWMPALSPPWGAVASVAAFLLGTLLAALVWHTRWPNSADAWAMRWQAVAEVHGDAAATILASAVKPVVALIVLASAGMAWRVKRWDAMALALVAAPASLIVEVLLKQLVHRQRPDGGASLLYPSGHVAVATAAALTAVLVVRVALVSPRTRAIVAWLAGGFVVAAGAARLVQTIHYVTDVLGGAATGVFVTAGLAWVITAGCQAGLCGGSSAPRREDDQAPPTEQGNRADGTPFTT